MTVPPEGTFTKIASGIKSNCAIHTDGTIKCWGYDAYFETEPPEGTFKSISGGNYHYCALSTEDELNCWGHNAYDVQTLDADNDGTDKWSDCDDSDASTTACN